MKINAATSNTEEIPFKTALNSGRADTSREPSIRSGRGPKNRNAKAKTITKDNIIITLNQNDSSVFIRVRLLEKG
jgi:hypothetical protein